MKPPYDPSVRDAVRIRIDQVISTPAITWPQGVIGEEDDLVVAAQVSGDVIRFSMP
ncbi:hypothetical protein NZK33_13415 [Cyanobium sp. FGCU-6]|nr:hypothetical protein [Cyanobium sp. FGCU6]